MISIAAPITAVVVLEDRATVTRRGTVALAAGQHRLAIAGVAPVLADKTIVARATGATVADARCERERVAAEAGELPTLEAERRSRALELARVHGEAAVARAEADGHAAIRAAALAELADLAARGIAPADAAPRLAELDAAEVAARARAIDAELDAADREAVLARLDARIADARARTGDEVARLVIDVVVATAGDVELVVDYVVPGAAWRPYHRARLVPGDAPRVEWTITACVWQATGEDWTDVALACSLERPSLGSDPPAFADDTLAVRRRPDTVTVEARDVDEHTAGLGGGTAGAPEVPGIDDGGLGLVLAATHATVRADGAPHRLDVGAFTAPAQLARVAIPARSPHVHLRARVVNTGAVPLLAGPVDLIMASGYVGRAEVGFVAPNEAFHVGFGPDAALRVHRTETVDRDAGGVLSGAAVTTRVAVRLSNQDAEPREVVVTERVPISEVEQVEVAVAAPDAYLLADDPRATGGEPIAQTIARAIDDRGLVTWTVALPPRGKGAVTLEYRVKGARGVAGI